MTVLNTTHTIELTTTEIDIIATALHGQYKSDKELHENSPKDQPAYIYQHMKLAQELRNSFGNIINRTYIGADA